MGPVPKYRDLTENQIDVMCNGCGPKGLAWILPDWRFRASCNHHDFNYWLGHTELDRKKADDQFYEMMIVDAKAACPHWWQKPKYLWYKSQAWLYYKSVRSGGMLFFEYAPTYKTWNDVRAKIYPLSLTPEQAAFLS